MESAQPASSASGRTLRIAGAAFAAIAMALAISIGACGRGEKKPDTGGVSDTTAYRGASTLTDTTAQITALGKFLQGYPESSFRSRAYRRLYDLESAADKSRAAAGVRRALRKEKQPAARSALHYILFGYTQEHDPDAVDSVIRAVLADKADLEYELYNAIAWDLAEKGRNLDQALELAERSVAKAPDSLAQATVLDTKGWVYYQRKEYAKAIETLTAAIAVSPEPYEEIEIHLAQALDAAGMKAEAREAFAKLLLTREDPEFRARALALTAELGGSPDDFRRDLDRRREERATPAPDFTLKNYAGQDITLSSFRGQVVLLNFWHPT
jgi:tetratricopeptide (TPR) repeat protein